MAENKRFELLKPGGLLTFQASVFDHSTNSPHLESYNYHCLLKFTRKFCD